MTSIETGYPTISEPLVQPPEFAVADPTLENQVAKPEIATTDYFSSETGAMNFGEVASSMVSPATIAYNGLRARFAEWRTAKNEVKVGEHAHGEEFYAGLGRIATRVVQERQSENLPGPATTTNPLDSQAESHRRMRYLRQGLPIPPRPGEPAPLTSLASEVTPINDRERLAEQQLAQRAREIRTKRRQQVSARKMSGTAGIPSEHRTRKLKRDMAAEDLRDYAAGRIDSFELAERKLARRAVYVSKTPPATAKRHGQLEYFGDRMNNDYDEAVDKARSGRIKAADKAARWRNEATNRRQEQADIRARR